MLLRGFQAVRLRAEACGRIGHARVQPEAVKIISEVVMVGDVAPRAGSGVGTQLVRQLGEHAHPWLAGNHFVPVRLVRSAEQQHVGQSRAVPPAFEIGFREAEAPAGDGFGDGTRVVDDERGGRAGLSPFEPVDVTARKMDGELADAHEMTKLQAKAQAAIPEAGLKGHGCGRRFAHTFRLSKNFPAPAA